MAHETHERPEKDRVIFFVSFRVFSWVRLLLSGLDVGDPLFKGGRVRLFRFA